MVIHPSPLRANGVWEVRMGERELERAPFEGRLYVESGTGADREVDCMTASEQAVCVAVDASGAGSLRAVFRGRLRSPQATTLNWSDRDQL